MTARLGSMPRPRRGPFGALGRLGGGISAVGVKELRGRMRGRRAFAILTIYLLVLGAFAWMVYLYLERFYSQQLGSYTYASAEIGRGIFSALLLFETLLVALLAPAVTAGAISGERERQTLGMLAATPISSLAIVVGKLLSALTYVFLLIAASIPLTALVFVFGGVAPDDVVRGYVVLLVTAIGFGAVGLACSAIMRRTQAAIIVAYTVVLIVTMGTRGMFLFWLQMNQGSTGGVVVRDVAADVVQAGKAPEALMWLNPFFAQLDVICGTETAYSETCRLVAETTGRDIFGIAVPVKGLVDDTTGGLVIAPDVGVWGTGGAIAPPAANVPGVKVFVDQAVGGLNDRAASTGPDLEPFGTLRDALWPQFTIAWLVIAAILTILSVQLVSPTRRWRLRLPARRHKPARSEG